MGKDRSSDEGMSEGPLPPKYAYMDIYARGEIYHIYTIYIPYTAVRHDKYWGTDCPPYEYRKKIGAKAPTLTKIN